MSIISRALHHNTSLTTLDLSLNLIGDQEQERLINPSFITGGVAIARMLEVNKTLRKLDLSWNKIRKDTALVLVKCLAHNNTLTSLNLSSNNLGDIAVQHLANSLRTNKAMVFLDLSYVNMLMFFLYFRAVLLLLWSMRSGALGSPGLLPPRYTTAITTAIAISLHITIILLITLTSYFCLSVFLHLSSTILHIYICNSYILTYLYTFIPLHFYTYMNRYNNVLPKGTIVMAHALEENHHMLDCNLEGNCIGEAGGKALLRAMRMAAEKKRQLRINFKNCNLHYSEPDLFNRHEPKMGSHSFHLDDPYDYMKARVLFEVYNNSFGALWKDVKHRELIVTGGPDDPNLEEGTLLIGDMRMTYIYTCIHIYIYDGSPTPLILTFSTASSFFQRHSFHPTSSHIIPHHPSGKRPKPLKIKAGSWTKIELKRPQAEGT